MTEKFLRVFHRCLWIRPRPQMLGLSTCLGAEEAVKHVLNIIEMLSFGLPARLEVITEDCRAGTAHHAQLPAQIREVLHLRGLSLSPLLHVGGAAHGSAKDVA